MAPVDAQVRPKSRPRPIDHPEAEPSIGRNLGVGNEARRWWLELVEAGILGQAQIDDVSMPRRVALRAHRLGIRRRSCDHRPQKGDKEPPSHDLGSLPYFKELSGLAESKFQQLYRILARDSS